MNFGDYQITKAGVVSGAVFWLLVMFFVAADSSCVDTESCGPSDLVLFAIIGLGMLVPSAIAAFIVSEVIGL